MAVGVFADGGFDPAARGAFCAAVGIALVVAVWFDGAAVARAARAAPVIALAALAALCALSALWAVNQPDRALRWALVIAAYAALAAIAGALAARPRGQRTIAAILAALATAAALAALAGVALRSEPLALHLGGEWQAAGPLEYPPALALVCLCGVPALVMAAVRARSLLGSLAAGALALNVLAIALASSRIAAALAAGAIAVTIAFAPRSWGRRRVASLWLVCGALPLGALALADPGDPASALSSDALRAGLFAAVALACAALWPALGSQSAPEPEHVARAGGRQRGLRVAVAGIAAIVLGGALAFGAAGAAERSGHGVEESAGATHGRAGHWEAAVDLYREHPLLGSGAESYGRAARRFDDGDPTLYAHNLPLELTAELGIAGALAALALYLLAARALWRARATEGLVLFGVGVGAFMLANLVDWPWHLAGVGAVWALALGALVAAGRPEQGRALAR